MALDFLPFEEGDKITPAKLNALVAAIMDGSIFTEDASNSIGEIMGAVHNELTSLEGRVTVLEEHGNSRPFREQFTLTAGQTSQSISKVPDTDSEIVSLNGQVLSKTGVPLGFIGDYTLINRTFNFHIDVSQRVETGDTLIISYWSGE